MFKNLLGAVNADMNYYSTAFLRAPKLLHIIPENKTIHGLTVLDNELFVVRGTSEVDVYDCRTFELTRKLTIPGSKGLQAIVACQHYTCLYISDSARKKQTIFRFDHRSKELINKWPVKGGCCGLSVTTRYSVLVTLLQARQVKEYEPNGTLIKNININVESSNSSIEYLRHCIRSSNGEYIISHGDAKAYNSGVRIFDANSRQVIHSYCGPPGQDVGQMIVPCQMTVDKHGYILVADHDNRRVELLSPTLRHIGYVEIHGCELDSPSALHLDELNCRLYIGEQSSGRLLVFGGNLSGTDVAHVDVADDQKTSAQGSIFKSKHF